MTNWLTQPWPWYVAGPLIGLTVPALLLVGNKLFGISSTLRHICAACLPQRLPYFQYQWKREQWNLLFVLGITVGGFIGGWLIPNTTPIQIHPQLAEDLAKMGVTDLSAAIPVDLFSWDSLLSLRGFILIVVGGFLVGFGTRYAGGCTSGHAITGIATLQWPSVLATICFLLTGIIVSHFLLPIILSL